MLSELCGTGVVSSARLRRQPYLQRVTSTSARILFTVSGEAPVTVDVMESSGKPVATGVEASPDGPPPAPLAVTIEGLEPDTIYCYRLNGMTAGAGFRTAPTPGNGRVRFSAFGDSGNGSESQRAVYAQLQTVPYDFVLHLGDVAYEKGSEWELENHYFSIYRGLTRSFAVFPVLGNHDDATNDGAAFLSAFDLPDNAVPSERERFYSFDWGPIHFVALDTERMTREQASWMDRDLQKNTQPWTVVYGHRPPYSSGHHGSNLVFRERFGPILYKHGVQLVLSGHDHSYERTRAIDGTTYVVSGGGGRDTRPVQRSEFTAHADEVHHFVFVEVDAKTLILHAIDGAGREFDSVRLDLPAS
jgi:hypothetical protein